MNCVICCTEVEVEVETVENPVSGKQWFWRRVYRDESGSIECHQDHVGYEGQLHNAQTIGNYEPGTQADHIARH